MKFLLADDHAVLRKGLIQLLAEAYPKAQFGEAGSTVETLDQLTRGGWTIVVLDIFMPGRSGLEVLREIRTHWPGLPILVVSSADEDQLAVRVLKAGASGYLNKQAAPEELVRAVGRLLAGGRYVSDSLAEQLAAELSGGAGQSGARQLSDREYAVLQHLLAGRSLKEIARELSLSVKTVSTYHTRIWEKLRVRNDVELVHYAIEHGLGETGTRGRRPAAAAARPPRRPTPL